MLQVDLCTFCLDAWGKSPTRGVLRNHIDPTYKHLQGPNALPHHQENHTPLRAYAIHVESKLVEVDLLEFAIELSPMNRQILMHSYLHDLYMHIYIYLFIDAIYCQPGLIILFHIYIYTYTYTFNASKERNTLPTCVIQVLSEPCRPGGPVKTVKPDLQRVDIHAMTEAVVYIA